MNQLVIFNNLEFGQIRMVELDGKPYAVGNDVAKSLGYARPYEAVSTHCKGAVTYRVLTEGGEQEVKVIPEGDIYRLIVKAADQSKNPDIKSKAERYERWVFDEVLPSIRKHGAYMTPDTLEKALTSPDFLIQLATKLKEEKQARLAAEKRIQLDRPKVIFAEALETSHNSILIGELAKLLKQNGVDIGQNRMFEWLRNNGYLGSKGEYYNLPTQKSMEMGLFEIKTRTVNNPDGSVRVTKTPKVTGKGQIYFINKFKLSEVI